MPRYTIPEHPDRFRVERHFSRAHYFILNDKTGKNEVCIPVASKADAEEFCRRLNAGEHDGSVSVPALKR